MASLLLLGGCFADTPGLELTVDVRLSEDRLVREPDQLTLTNARGADLSIRHGWIAVTHVALTACPNSAQTRSWLDVLVPAAYAHEPVVSGDAQDAVVVPLDARAPITQVLGVLRPAPGTWCSVTVSYGPVGALDDTDLPDGTWSLDLGPDGSPNVLGDAGRYEATAPLNPPLTLGRTHRTAILTVALPLAAWLDGIGPDDDDGAVHAAIQAALGAPPTVTVP